MTRDEAVRLAGALLPSLPPADKWVFTKSGASFDVGMLTRVRMERCLDPDAQSRLVAFLARSREIVEALMDIEPVDWFAARRTHEEEHPIDAEVRGRLARSSRARALDERLAHLKRLVGDSDVNIEAWLELEEIWNERSANREIAYYNVGVQHGRADRAVVDAIGSESHADLPSAVRQIGRLADAISSLAGRTLEQTDGGHRDEG